jgi:hypothetical protein
MATPREERQSLWQWFLSWVTVPSPALAFATVAAVLLVTNVALFVSWRGQVGRTEVALREAQALREVQAKQPATAVATRVLAVPILKADEANLAPGQAQKSAIHLPADLPDTVEIPFEFPSLAGSAIVDATVSSSGHTVWTKSDLKLSRGRFQTTVLRIPFAALRPHLDRPLELQAVERGVFSQSLMMVWSQRLPVRGLRPAGAALRHPAKIILRRHRARDRQEWRAGVGIRGGATDFRLPTAARAKPYRKPRVLIKGWLGLAGYTGWWSGNLWPHCLGRQRSHGH